MRFQDRLEIVTASGVEDAYGDITYDWDNPEVLVSLPATVYTMTGGALEGDSGWNMLTVTRKVLIPPDERKINIGDQRIRWRGQLYQIVTDSGVITRGRFPHHRELEITRWNV